MRHKKDIRRLGRTKSHRKALMRNLAISFFESQHVETTEAKAKELRRVVEKIITLGKKGDLASVRRIQTILNHAPSLPKVKEVAQKYAGRAGGYTRILRLGPRRGDASEMVLMRLV